LAEGGRPDTKMIARRVLGVLEADLAAGGFDLLDVRVFQGGGRYQLRVYVDDASAPGGISMGDVAKAARTAGMLLEEADLFVGQYILEVSSPGIRRPLRTLAHYEAAVGEAIDLKVAGSSRVRGVLQAVEGDELVVLLPTSDETDETGEAGETDEKKAAAEPVRVPLARVLEGNLNPEFDAQAIINADRRERKDTRRKLRQEKSNRKKKKGRPKNRAQKDGGNT